MMAGEEKLADMAVTRVVIVNCSIKALVSRLEAEDGLWSTGSSGCHHAILG